MGKGGTWMDLADIILNMENEPDLQELFDICTFRHMVR
jgi:hypothetical protein